MRIQLRAFWDILSSKRLSGGDRPSMLIRVSSHRFLGNAFAERKFQISAKSLCLCQRERNVSENIESKQRLRNIYKVKSLALIRFGKGNLGDEINPRLWSNDYKF